MSTKIHFLSYRAQFVLESHVWDKTCKENQNIYLMFNYLSAPPPTLEKCLYEIIWKNVVGLGRRNRNEYHEHFLGVKAAGA